MKKALHNEPDVFLSSEDGRISAWGSGAESALVAIANQGLKYDFEETTLALPEPMLLERAAAIWLIRLLEEGVTGRLIDEVNRWTSKIRYRRLLVMNEGEPPQWHEIADLGSGLNPETRVAYAISHLIGSGAFQRLRRCQEEVCKNFYLGRPDSTYCSKRCGNRARGKRKRKLDRESGILPDAGRLLLRKAVDQGLIRSDTACLIRYCLTRLVVFREFSFYILLPMGRFVYHRRWVIHQQCLGQDFQRIAPI